MNNEEDIIKQLQAERASLQVQIKRMRADYNTLNSIQTNVNNSLRESNAEVLELQTQLTLKNHEIAALSSMSDTVSFFQMLSTNLRFIQCQSLPIKLGIGGTITYKICNKIMSSDENKKNLKEDTPTFSLEKVDLPVPEKASHQAVVEISVAPPPPIQQIKFSHTIWFPF
tara:strand:+ start:143 stop:652 length:510 start_codon:yes stop_codon:yes gene_type:complete